MLKASWAYFSLFLALKSLLHLPASALPTVPYFFGLQSPWTPIRSWMLQWHGSRLPRWHHHCYPRLFPLRSSHPPGLLPLLDRLPCADIRLLLLLRLRGFKWSRFSRRARCGLSCRSSSVSRGGSFTGAYPRSQSSGASERPRRAYIAQSSSTGA